MKNGNGLFQKKNSHIPDERLNSCERGPLMAQKIWAGEGTRT